LELQIEGISVKLVAEKENYPLISPSKEMSSGTSTSGFKEGQVVTCFGVLISHRTEKELPTLAFREIWGGTLLDIKEGLEGGEKTRAHLFIIIPALLGLLFVGIVVLTFFLERRERDRKNTVPSCEDDEEGEEEGEEGEEGDTGSE